MLNASNTETPWAGAIRNKRDDVCDREIQRKVAELWGVEIKDVRGSSASQRLTQARCALIYALRCYTDLTASEIAQFLGRDTSTISHASKRAQVLAKRDKLFRSRFNKLCLHCKYWRR